MKAGGPRRLPHILQAIEDLGDVRGCSTKRIIDQLESTHYGNTERPKNLTGDVRRALKYAVDNGIVRERAGKFTVASFYGTKRGTDPNKSIFDCRRRRKRGGKRRRRRRHASLSSVTDSEASLSGEDWETNRDRSYSRSRSRSPQYTTEGIISHRRRRGKKRRRRRGRRRSLNDRDDEPKTPGRDGRCLAHHMKDCENPGCQRNHEKEMDEEQPGSYIN
ncbi:uncharacterized protein LOC123684401 [Harmonia axyridis]|uniref:uncharacterized protein LOC123684401 n=1 Tax=Harmonia axyridis TaxID=115357 RepID=UPI001E2753F4|nr:uncharacterized protein LOC123684401 [Harmonia axyridis]